KIFVLSMKKNMKQKIERDNYFMEQALLEAQQGLFTAHPNPRVGCIFVKNENIIARGAHIATGYRHAEVQAIHHATQSLMDSTCYVTLEPCTHTGHTPPCVDTLIAQKIQRCVIATVDPNPKVSGRGIQKLKASGIVVDVGIKQEEAQALNPGFFKRMLSNKPFVFAKIASSLDGKTGMLTGESQWITSNASRLDAHYYRARVGAIITSWKTVNMDDPSLTVRAPEILNQIPHPEFYKQPVRIILDTHLKTKPTAKIFDQAGTTWVMIRKNTTYEKIRTWQTQLKNPANTKIVAIPCLQNRLNLQALLYLLAENQINEVLLECGSNLLGAFLQEKLIDTCIFYFAPKILGSKTQGMFNLPLENLTSHIPLKITTVEKLQEDVKIIASCTE
ncbi:MAG TPA: bifunctional diaminohydroxyphosphoribosylaminopyrimidine deaminase/5-amino-6-(5-phosphoribosylamino)uracil reductase RibD, partial [Gammaproteobacteria bacterium]|nr:bifunctional diaminohydroxyphosphoribosylaminopyrimidine deaminase/5-amino-6-(5-phosphoribosylamino)uracil reductase RibD [Gammaproteobacteria bacterium]